jgi:hypothetical protein
MEIKNFKLKKIILFLILFLLFFNNSYSIEFEYNFTGPGKITKLITFETYPLTYFSFSIEGKLFSSSYPSNVTVNFGDVGNSDWNYSPYLSTESLDISKIYSAQFLDFNSTHDLYFITGEDDVNSGIVLGSITNSIFNPSSNLNSGNLKLSTTQNLDKNRIALFTDKGVQHIFVPGIYSNFYTIGLYVANGGATYFCNSNTSFQEGGGCNLSLSSALNPTYLARGIDNYNFDFKENVPSNNLLLDKINNVLSSCSSFPCSIPVSITSKSPGTVLLSNLSGAVSINPPKILLVENSNNYQITINGDDTLTKISYFYSNTPNVYIIPTIPKDDNSILSSSQLNYIDSIKNNIKNKWDSITENKLPLNFYMVNNSVKVENYSKSENNFSKYFEESLKLLDPIINKSTPNIIIILDINDNFPSEDPFNIKSSFIPETNSIISKIYINGFTSKIPKTFYDNYETEILNNIIIHELSHSFVSYNGNPSYFYSDHPASFSSLSEFPTYSISKSPTSNEGYFSLYSILNQIRPYLLDSEIQKPIELSPLDKMSMGLLNKYDNSYYSFYATQISKVGNRFKLNPITKYDIILAKDLLDTNFQYWNVLKNNNEISIPVSGSSKSFTISKNDQRNRSLVVFADDNLFKDNFEIFSNNAQSTLNFLDNFSNSTTVVIVEDITPPSIPSNLKLIFKNTTSINFSWDPSVDDVNISYYKVFRDSVEIGTTNNTYYLDSNLIPNTKYIYQVLAIDTSENPSSLSSELLIKTFSNLNLNITLNVDSKKIDPNNDKNNLFDNDLETYWASDDSIGFDNWVEIIFNETILLNSLTINWANDSEQNKFMTSQELILESYSNNSYVEIKNFTNSLELENFSFSNLNLTTNKIRIFQPQEKGPISYPSIFWLSEIKLNYDYISNQNSNSDENSGNDNSGDNQNTGGSDTNSGGSSSGGGGSGGTNKGSSTKSTSSNYYKNILSDRNGNSSKDVKEDLSNYFKENKCIPLYEESTWGPCILGIQEKIIHDLNNCKEDEKVERTCLINNTEFENQFLNAKEFQVKKIEDKIYIIENLSSLKGLELFYTKKKLEDKKLLIVDNSTGEYYLSNLVDEEDGEKYYYTLKKVDQDSLTELKNEGFIETPLNEKVQNLTKETVKSKTFLTVMVVSLILFFITLILFIIYYIKRKNNKKSSFSNFSNNNLNLNNNFEKNYNSQQLNDARNYIKNNKFLGEEKLRENLKNSGWSDETLDELFKK